jgi:hypothetical protein
MGFLVYRGRRDREEEDEKTVGLRYVNKTKKGREKAEMGQNEEWFDVFFFPVLLYVCLCV